jgi:hypothetical protein
MVQGSRASLGSLAHSDELTVVKTGFHAPMNERFERILSPGHPGHSTHVTPVRLEYDSTSGERAELAAAHAGL